MRLLDKNSTPVLKFFGPRQYHSEIGVTFRIIWALAVVSIADEKVAIHLWKSSTKKVFFKPQKCHMKITPVTRCIFFWKVMILKFRALPAHVQNWAQSGCGALIMIQEAWSVNARLHVRCCLFPYFFNIFENFHWFRYVIPCNVSQPTPYLFILTARLASI